METSWELHGASVGIRCKIEKVERATSVPLRVFSFHSLTTRIVGRSNLSPNKASCNFFIPQKTATKKGAARTSSYIVRAAELLARPLCGPDLLETRIDGPTRLSCSPYAVIS
jgi:hypothetical protein